MEPDNLALDQYILALTGKERPKVCFLPTASGDADEYIERFHGAMGALETEHSHLSLTRYNQADPHKHLLDQDVIYVGGGNSFQMLLVWRAHGIDRTLDRPGNKESFSVASAQVHCAGSAAPSPTHGGALFVYSVMGWAFSRRVIAPTTTGNRNAR